MQKFLPVVISFVVLALTGCASSSSIPGSSAGSSSSDVVTSKTPNPTKDLQQSSPEALQKEAEAGNAQAQFMLGAMEHDGTGVPQDLAKARQWFTKAAAQKNALALFNLGLMDYKGEAGPQDLRSAALSFAKAADLNDPNALFNLGAMAYRGEGIPQNFPQALGLFQKAALVHQTQAYFNLGVMALNGQGQERSPVDAYAWMSISSESGDANAGKALAQIKGLLTPDEQTAAARRITKLKTQYQIR